MNPRMFGLMTVGDDRTLMVAGYQIDRGPLIGNLFKSTVARDDRSELLIFVTPKILQGANLDIR